MLNPISQGEDGSSETVPGNMSPSCLLNGRCEDPEQGASCSPSQSQLSLLERVILTRAVWQPPNLSREEAKELLKMQLPGSFLVSGTDSGERILVMQVRTRHRSQGGKIREFLIKQEKSVVSLDRSCLGFLGLCQLIAFCSVCRDVLPSVLRPPPSFLCARSTADLQAMARLGMTAFLASTSTPSREFLPARGSTAGEVKLDSGPTEGSQPQQLCSIQVTSENGALCIINPLFVAEHGDGWLTRGTAGQIGSWTRSTIRLKHGQRSKGSARVRMRKISIASKTADQAGQSVPEVVQPQEKEMGRLLPEAEDRQSLLPGSVRRKALQRHPAQGTSDEMDPEIASESSCHRGDSRESEPEKRDSKSPHRASWIEEDHLGTWALKKCRSESSLGSHDSFLLPPIPELDSLSISSIEDEGDGHTTPPLPCKKRHSTISSKVRDSFLVVSSAFGGLLPLQKRITRKVLDLSQDSDSYFGGLVQSFLSHILKGPSGHLTSTEMLQDIRQTITNLKTYLCESSELRAAVEHVGQEDFDLDTVVENALSKCLLKPLKSCIYSQLLEFHTRDGTLKKLRENQQKMKAQSLPELGVTAGVPDTGAMEKIQQKLHLMHSLYSPKEKVTQLLKVCKLIYDAMNRVPGKREVYGADDFLPVLTYVLLGSDINFLHLDVEYMMELLDPSQLQGEGGYYLTTLFGALFHIGNVQSTAVTRQISLEAQRSLHQWQRRRTIHQSQASRQNTQDILYVSLREPFNNQKILTVPVDMTTASVCAACSQKFQIQDKEDYGLFLFRNNEVQALAADSCPQQVKAELLQAGASSMVFVYRLKDGALAASPQTD